MPIHDWECGKCGKVEELNERWDKERVRCKCGGWMEQLWVSGRGGGFLKDPAVLHVYPDGTFGVPGKVDAPTPAGAERVEIRSMAQYNRVMKRLNDGERRRVERLNEKEQELREDAGRYNRGHLIEMLAREKDPMARDILRSAIDRPTTWEPHRMREVFSEAFEMMASNRDGWWDGGVNYRK